MEVRESHELEPRNALEDQPTATTTTRTSIDRTSSGADLAAPLDVDGAEQKRQHRRYQYTLLICGFLMTFNVIGINSSYGIFQVRLCSFSVENDDGELTSGRRSSTRLAKRT